jgi:hypothetical protein
MRFALNSRTWSDHPTVSDEPFLREVRETLAQRGSWETEGEFRMGAGPTVRVSVLNTDGTAAYEATAVWMDMSLSARAVYATLEEALVAVPTLGRALFQVLQEDGWKGMLDQQGQPWPVSGG